jgi:hypothetical protein
MVLNVMEPMTILLIRMTGIKQTRMKRMILVAEVIEPTIMGIAIHTIAVGITKT